MNRSTVLTGLVVLASLMVGGCLTMNRVQEPSSPDSAFVCGRIDLSGAKDQLNWVSMLAHPEDPNKKRLNYGGITDVMVHVHSDGTFFAENVDPGQYYLFRLSI